MNILRLVLLGLAALAGIVTGAALLQKAIRPETSSAPLIATASTRPGEPGRSPYEIDAARRAFEEKLKTAPEYAAFFDRLKTVFNARGLALMWMRESRIKEEKQRAERFSDNINSYSSYIEIAHLAGLQDEPGTHGDIYLDRLTSVTRQPDISARFIGNHRFRRGGFAMRARSFLSAAGFGPRALMPAGLHRRGGRE